MYQTLLCTVENGIATITLNRPEANNSMDRQMLWEIPRAIEACDAERDVKVIIVTGSGKNFSAGGDIRAMSTFEFLTPEVSKLAGEMSASVRKCSKPVIAMVNGTAAGAGCALALACDFRIMTEKSLFLTAFSNVALSGDSGCMYFLYQIVGLAKTLELMMLSEPIRSEEALRLGLATKVVPFGELEAETMDLANRLKERALGAIAKQKRLCWEQFCEDYAAYSQLEQELFVACAESEDHREAVTAFLEKRKPVFPGK
jgi:2-(1,2-epoxy-1,2-dihydrophenyl)acetyl-CoA isomerase